MSWGNQMELAAVQQTPPTAPYVQMILAWSLTSSSVSEQDMFKGSMVILSTVPSEEDIDSPMVD